MNRIIAAAIIAASIAVLPATAASARTSETPKCSPNTVCAPAPPCFTKNRLGCFLI